MGKGQTGTYHVVEGEQTLFEQQLDEQSVAAVHGLHAYNNDTIESLFTTSHSSEVPRTLCSHSSMSHLMWCMHCNVLVRKQIDDSARPANDWIRRASANACARTSIVECTLN